jgi:hypothetical protein
VVPKVFFKGLADISLKVALAQYQQDARPASGLQRQTIRNRRTVTGCIFSRAAASSTVSSSSCMPQEWSRSQKVSTYFTEYCKISHDFITASVDGPRGRGGKCLPPTPNPLRDPSPRWRGRFRALPKIPHAAFSLALPAVPKRSSPTPENSPPAPASIDRHHHAGIGSPPATAGGTSSPGTPAPWQTKPQTRSGSAGIPP